MPSQQFAGYCASELTAPLPRRQNAAIVYRTSAVEYLFGGRQTPMLNFSEAFVGGFFGFGRTYGAVSRFECDSIQSLDADWLESLKNIKEWRAARKERATALHLYFESPSGFVREVISFAVSHVLLPPGGLAAELRGLHLEIAIFRTPDMEQYLDLVLHREAAS